MVKILGIGGFLFRAKDPAALADWYDSHFGIAKIPEDYGGESWQQQEGETVFAPFPQDTTYFGRSEQTWMLNFRVTDLDVALADLTEAGIAVDVDPQIYPNGRFASLSDPEGNPIQLWQPA